MKLVRHDLPAIEADVHWLIGIARAQRGFDPVITDQPWNPFASVEPLYNGVEIRLFGDEISAFAAQALTFWRDGKVPLISPLGANREVSLRESGLLAGYTLMPGVEGTYHLLQSIVARDFDIANGKTPMIFGTHGLACVLQRDQVASWDGGGRKEPPTRRSGTHAAVRPEQ